MGSLAWLLWPTTWNGSLEPEPLFVFGVAVVVWGMAEFTTSEETPSKTPTQNDIIRAREIIGYHKEQLKYILRDHDHGNAIEPEYLREVSLLAHDLSDIHFFFNNKKLQIGLDTFEASLTEFRNFFAGNSYYDKFGSVMLQSIIPYDMKASGDISQSKREQIETANELATKAWHDLDNLYKEIRKLLPSAFETTVQTKWHPKNSMAPK